MENDLTFGQWLKRRRRGLGLTQRALGERVAYASETIRKVEADELRPSRQLAERLAEALEVPPSERARFIAFARDEAGGDLASLSTNSVDFPAQASPADQRHNLPAPLTTFIGRGQEVADLRRLLTHRRLVTLLGAGGMGKSRLAVEAASGLISEYPHGVWLVELAGLSDPARVTQAVARVLGVSETVGQSALEALTAYFRDKTLLLLLDNCEHLIDACAALAVALLRAGAGVRILANSREALAVEGEVVYDVPALALPPADGPELTPEQLSAYDAVRLFVDRAALALPGFELTTSNAPAVTQVCRGLEGMPLAIELAAARVKLLQVGQIAARLEDRFGLLRRESRSAPPRHLTLQATIDWSYALLPHQEQVVLRRASVFAGGWTLEAAEAVCVADDLEPEEVLDQLSNLARKSMVVVEREPGRSARYRLLETIREYSRKRLHESGERALARDRHARFFLEFAEEAEQYVHHAQQATWLDRLRLELNNVRAAIDWYHGQAPDAQRGARLASSLWCFCILHGHWVEGTRWLEEAIADLGPPDEHPSLEAGIVRGHLYTRAGLVVLGAGQKQRAIELSSEGLEYCRSFGTPDDLAEATFVRAYAAVLGESPAKAKPLFEEALRLAQAAGDRWYEAASHALLGSIAFDQGRLEEAERRVTSAEVIDRELQDEVAVGDNLGMLSLLAQWRGRFDEAIALADQRLVNYRRMGVRRNLAGALSTRGALACAVGDLDNAARYQEEALTLFREQGNANAATSVLVDQANVARRRGDISHAAVLFREALAASGAPDQPTEQRHPFDSLSLGALARCQGDAVLALAHYRAALEHYSPAQLASPPDVWCAVNLTAVLLDLALLLAVGVQADQAVRLFAAADAVRTQIGYVEPPVDQADTRPALAALRVELGDPAFAAAWAEGAALSLAEATALGLEAIAAASVPLPVPG